LNPNLLFVEADHDMRNPADLIALAKLANSVYAVPGVRAVQGITRPLISPLPQGNLATQAGYVGERVAQMAEVITSSWADSPRSPDGLGCFPRRSTACKPM
jgi:RND superfamily putative drug exporter